MLDAYYVLTRDRSIGLAVGPIPWSAIDRFIDRRLARGAIDADEAEALEILVMRIDDHERAAEGKPTTDTEDDGEDGKGGKPPPKRRKT